MKIAIVNDWLVTYGGAERLLEQLIVTFPDAKIFCLFDFLPSEQRSFLNGKYIQTTFLQKFKFFKKYYRYLFPFMPIAIEQLNLSEYDIVISCSHSISKGVLVGPNQLHICICYTPMRYAWDMYHKYIYQHKSFGILSRIILIYVLHNIRIWDVRTANGVDKFYAISHFVSRRIMKSYRRASEILYPPVNIHKFKPVYIKEDFYFVSSRLVSYKNVTLIVEAFKKMPDKKLIIIGHGSESKKIAKLSSKNITYLSFQSNEVLCSYMQRAKAYIFAAEEDFGVSLVEAQSCGTPVIAFGKGGALEIIRGQNHESPTGVFFYEQTQDSIINAINLFESRLIYKINLQECFINAQRFSAEIFRNKIFTIINKDWIEFSNSLNNGIPLNGNPKAL